MVMGCVLICKGGLVSISSPISLLDIFFDSCTQVPPPSLGTRFLVEANLFSCPRPILAKRFSR